MNILHLRASNFYGGPERQIHQHARKALNTNFNITIASFSEQNKEPEFLAPIAKDDVFTHCFQVNSAYDKKAISLLEEYIKSNDIAVLCTHDYRSDFIARQVRKRSSIKWIAFSRGWTRENMKVRFYHWLDKKFIKSADHIVAVSGKQGEWLEQTGIKKEKITVIHNAIDPSLFDNIDPVNLHEKYSIPDENKIIIGAGRFSTEKGQLEFIKSFRNIVDKTSKASKVILIFYGDGPDYEKAKELVSKLKLDDNVILPGYDKNVIGCIKGADVLVNPSLSEGLPNIVLEGMALKKPVIATSVGGVPEIITHMETGYLVPASDSEAIVEGILFLLNNTEHCLKFAEKAYRFIIDECSFECQNEKLCKLYASL